MVNDIYNADCFDVMPIIPDASIDMILCDMPFGTTKAKWDIALPLEKLWEHYRRIIKPNGAILLFAQTPFDKVLGASNLNMLRYEWIWEKTHSTGYQNAKKMPMKAHENVLVFYKKLPVYNFIKTTGHPRKISTAAHKRNSKKSELYGASKDTTYDSTERYPRSVLKFPSDKQKSKLNPTQKPVALLEYFVKTYTNPGQIVLDNCSGSGSTAVACKNTGRNFILIEKDPVQWKQSVDRLATLETVLAPRQGEEGKDE